MSSLNLTPQDTLYEKYKKRGEQIYTLLDPKNQLRGLGLSRAAAIATSLVEQLPPETQVLMISMFQEAIEWRETWAKRYTFAPKWMKENHKTYIDFLKGIKRQLSKNQGDKAVAFETNTPKLGVGDTTDDTVNDTASNTADNGLTDLTPDQVDFLAFLGAVLALAQEAAALWKEVEEGKLPIWTAAARKWHPPRRLTCSMVQATRHIFAVAPLAVSFSQF